MPTLEEVPVIGGYFAAMLPSPEGLKSNRGSRDNSCNGGALIQQVLEGIANVIQRTETYALLFGKVFNASRYLRENIVRDAKNNGRSEIICILTGLDDAAQEYGTCLCLDYGEFFAVFNKDVRSVL